MRNDSKQGLRCISPVDGRIYVERALLGDPEIAATLERARTALRSFRSMPLMERQAIAKRAVEAMLVRQDGVAEEISWQMGRPIAQWPGEIDGFEERARHMIAIAYLIAGKLRHLPQSPYTTRCCGRA